jgi:hypothetical protein
MQYSSNLLKICCETLYIFGMPAWGIARVLNSFTDEQYLFKGDINLWCLITKCLNEGIGFLVRLRNTPPRVKIYVMEPNVFLEYLKRGITSVLNSFGHEQYPIDSLDQNNSTRGV